MFKVTQDFIKNGCFVILSAKSSLNSDYDNVVNSNKLLSFLVASGLEFNKSIGIYNGQTEESFIIKADSWHDVAILKALAFELFDQESVFVGRYGRFWLKFAIGKSLIGKGLTFEPNSDNMTLVDGLAFNVEF